MITRRKLLSSLLTSSLWLALLASTVPSRAQEEGLPLVKRNRFTAPRETRSPEMTSNLLVFLAPGTDPQQFARGYGFTIRKRLQSDPNAYVFATPSLQYAIVAQGGIQNDFRVRAVYNDRLLHLSKRGFTPNDPFFVPYDTKKNLVGQWHLKNAIVKGRDVNIEPAWNRSLTGKGVVVGIVDDGIQGSHPDIKPNYSAKFSYDFTNQTLAQQPRLADDNHGTSVAGVTAARGGNGIGGTGAAPYATIAGLRAVSGESADSDSTDATLYLSNATTPTIVIKNHSYGPSDIFVDTTPEYNAITTTTAFGVIHVWAAGNEREDDNGKPDKSGDAAKDQINNHPDVIVISAMNSDGTFSYYSDFGACVFAVTPSNGDDNAGQYGIFTTDRTGNDGYNTADATDFPDTNYTSTFGGTSSAAPLAAGVLALVKQAQPKLTPRFAKHLLALTSRLIDPDDKTPTSDGGWIKNAANFAFNENYGFGLMDTDSLTRRAVEYTDVTALETLTTGKVNVKAAIPDNSTTGITRTFHFNSTTPLENVLVTLDIAHARRGDLTAFLTSPSGRKARLVLNHPNDTAKNLKFSFCANAFWGENPTGDWKINVQDVASGRTGTLNSFTVTARLGRLVAVPVLKSISPTSTTKGKSSLTLSLTGQSLTPASYVSIDGVKVPTRFISYKGLTATLPGSELKTARTAKIRIVTPDPGGSSTTVDLMIK